MTLTAHPNVNDIWIGIVIEALAAAGVRHAVLCAGGRSATMVLALHDDARFGQPLVSNDERSGAYAAIGAIRATGEPAVIVTTSGSAVANVIPALTEAHECGLPLVLLSCDRPRALRDCAFGQMIDHIGACRSFVRASADLPDPSADAEALAALSNTLTQVLEPIGGAQPGPVQINLPLGGYFDSTEPEPSSVAIDIYASGAPAVVMSSAQEMTLPLDIMQLFARLDVRRGMRAMVVAGPDCGLPAKTLAAFVCAAGLPVFADTASGLRSSGLPTVINGHDAVALQASRALAPPELVIRFGHAPVMPAVQHYLRAHPCPTLKFSRTLHTHDYLHPQVDMFPTSSQKIPTVLALLADSLGGGDRRWLSAWQQTARRARGLREAVLDMLGWGELQALRAIFEETGFAFMHLGNSMPIRHADLLYETRENGPDVYCNRGVNGIDGTLGTFIGEAKARGDAGLLVLGDLAFLHDLPALALAQRLTSSACICVINNGGGAIFDFMPVANRPNYDVAIRNSHDFDATRIAAGFGLGHAVADSLKSLRAALRTARSQSRASIIEVRVPKGSARSGMLALGNTFATAGASLAQVGSRAVTPTRHAEAFQ